MWNSIIDRLIILNPFGLSSTVLPYPVCPPISYSARLSVCPSGLVRDTEVWAFPDVSKLMVALFGFGTATLLMYFTVWTDQYGPFLNIVHWFSNETSSDRRGGVSIWNKQHEVGCFPVYPAEQFLFFGPFVISRKFIPQTVGIPLSIDHGGSREVTSSGIPVSELRLVCRDSNQP